MFKSAFRVLVIVGCVASLAACGGGSGAAKKPSKKVAATADITIVGDGGLAGKLTSPRITCSLPTIYGMSVVVVGRVPDKKVLVSVAVLQRNVTVGVSTGSGAQYRGRYFSGSGVTGFGPRKGAKLDSSVNAVVLPGPLPGTLGKVTSVKGDISCGSQRPGSSTIVVTGATADGTTHRRLQPVLVKCSAKNVVITGLSVVGSRRELVTINVVGGVATLLTLGTTATNQFTHHQYNMPAGTAVYAKRKIRLNGNATETVLAGATPHVIQVVGTAACGAA